MDIEDYGVNRYLRDALFVEAVRTVMMGKVDVARHNDGCPVGEVVPCACRLLNAVNWEAGKE